jgi:transcription antitermination factor NusG
LSLDKNWYAIYTRPRWEKKLAEKLTLKNIEHYCPINKVSKQWSDRVKVIKEPLFKGYIFVCVPEENKWALKEIDGVINFVYWLGKPAKIKQDDIDTIKKFLNEFDNVLVENYEPVSVNNTVRIKQGIFMNYKGLVLEVKGAKAKVRIKQLGVELIAQFDKNNLFPISPSVS